MSHDDPSNGSARRGVGGRGLFTLKSILGLVLGCALPFALYVVLASHGDDPTVPLMVVTFVALLISLLLLAWRGLVRIRGPRTPRAPLRSYPPVTAIVMADANATAEDVALTAQALVAIPYLAPLTVVLTYEHAAQLTLLSAVASARESTVTQIPVSPAASEFQHLAAAVPHLDGEFAGILLAGQRPQRDSFTRAWLWLSNGYEVVQGHVAYVETESTWVGRLAAVDAEIPGSVPYPLTHLYHAREGIGNAYSLVSALRAVAGNADSIRKGRRLVYDDKLVAVQRPPPNLTSWWQGRVLSARDRLRLLTSWRSRPHQAIIAWLDVTYWRAAYAWLSLEVPALVVYRIWRHGHMPVITWTAPLVALILLWGLAPALVANRIAAAVNSSFRRRRSALWRTTLIFPLIQTCRNSAERTAQLDALFNLNSRARHRDAQMRNESAPVSEEIQTPDIVPATRGLSEVVSTGDEVGDDSEEILLARLAALQGRNDRLRFRIEGLQRRITDQQEALTAISHFGRSELSGEELERVREIAADLNSDPHSLPLIASVSQHAPTVATVVNLYAEFEDKLARSASFQE